MSSMSPDNYPNFFEIAADASTDANDSPFLCHHSPYASPFSDVRKGPCFYELGAGCSSSISYA